jgi:hypothetical protein
MVKFLDVQFSPVPSSLLVQKIFLSTIEHAQPVICLESHSGNGNIRHCRHVFIALLHLLWLSDWVCDDTISAVGVK